MSANGPTGISPPNSSAIMVSTHGIGSPRTAQAVAYVEWVCTTPPTCGHLAVDVGLRRGVRRRRVLALRRRGPGGRTRPCCAGVRSSYETPVGLMTIRSWPGTRAETLPAVHTTSW